MPQDRSDNAASVKPIEQGMIARAILGVRHMVRDARQAWFGPLEPIKPQAQDAKGRQFDYPVGYNVNIQPRSNEPITFDMLRQLSDCYDLLRLVIETRKDQIATLEWQIKPRDPKRKSDDRCKMLQEFFTMPDREHTWNEWLRMLLEDMLVIDAACIYPRMTRGGGVHSFEIMNGATIKRVINADGRTPEAPDVAYQQVLKGIPAVDYSRDELVYKPRNLRSHRIYGMSPVEQIILTVNIALNRQLNMLSYYTDGNVPNLLIKTPKEWQPEQIASFQKIFDEMVQGKSKHRAIFIPEGTDPIDTKTGIMVSEADEWLARVTCFAFSISPLPFIKMMNRGTSDTAKETSKEEGVAPTMLWVSDTMNTLIWKYFGFTDLCFSWHEESEIDPKAQAEINNIKLRNGTLTINEARSMDGQDNVDGGDEPLIYTVSGAIPLSDAIEMSLNPPPSPFNQDNDDGEGEGEETEEQEEEEERTEKLVKKKSSKPSGAIGKSFAQGARARRDSLKGSSKNKRPY